DIAAAALDPTGRFLVVGYENPPESTGADAARFGDVAVWDVAEKDRPRFDDEPATPPDSMVPDAYLGMKRSTAVDTADASSTNAGLELEMDGNKPLEIHSIAFSPGGQRLVVAGRSHGFGGTWQGRAYIWSITDADEIINSDFDHLKYRR